MSRAVLGLGANLGDARETLAAAVRSLAVEPAVQVVAVSGLWRTAPVGGPAQPDYRNAVVVVDTQLPARAVLVLAHRLEDAAGRERTVRWGPRTLDVDVLAVDALRSDDPELTLPHPRAHERAFVLMPWAEVTPQWPLAVGDGPAREVRQWAGDLAEQDVSLEASGAWWR